MTRSKGKTGKKAHVKAVGRTSLAGLRGPEVPVDPPGL